MGVSGLRGAGFLAGRYGSAQCSASIPGQRACQNGAAAEEIASVMRRPEIVSRAPARSTRSRRRRRLQPVRIQSGAGRLGQDAAGDVHDAGQARQETSSLTSLQAKASTAWLFDFNFLPRPCDFARLVEE